MLNIIKYINKTGLKNIYLFYGEEDYLKKYYISEIKNFLIRDQELIDLNFSYWDLDLIERDNLKELEAKILDALISSPLFSDYRVIVLKNLLANNKKINSDLILDRLIKINKSEFENKSNIIVLIVEDKIDKRARFYKKLSELEFCEVLEVKKQINSELIRWIIKLCERENKIIAKENAELIIKNLGLSNNINMSLIKQEINKLICFSSDSKNKVITREEIDLIITKNINAKIFELIKFIANKNFEQAYISLENLISLKEEPLVILSLIARQFILILKTKVLSSDKNNLSINQIASLIKTQSFIIKECLEQSKNFSLINLKQALDKLLELDFKIKSGQINNILAIKNFILNIASA